MRNLYALGATDACSCGLGFVEQAREVLFLFRFQLEKPGPDLGELFQLSRVKKNTDPVPCFLVIQCEGITPDVDHGEPSIADGAGGKELNRIGQALGSFTEGIEDSSLGKKPTCLIHHETPNKYAHSLETMERPHHFHKLLERIVLDFYRYFLWALILEFQYFHLHLDELHFCIVKGGTPTDGAKHARILEIRVYPHDYIRMNPRCPPRVSFHNGP